MGKDEANTLYQSENEATTPDNVEALLEAARYDDIDDVISLASAGVSLDSKDSQGRTALHMAAANGHLDIVDYLIKNGVVLLLVMNYVKIVSDEVDEASEIPLGWASSIMSAIMNRVVRSIL